MATDFGLPPDTAVFVCRRVLDGAPILHVSRDQEEDWQFLCGEDHSDDARDPGKLCSLDFVLRRDPSLAELADLAPYENAQRHSPRHPWVRHDGYEDIVLENVETFGWHAVLVPDDEVGPGFAYTIGQDPEIIVFGLAPELMHAILDACGKAEEIRPDVPLPGFLEGHPVVFKPVAKARYKDFLGYAMWYHEGGDFAALQCVWPDKAGNFPWDPGFRKDWRHLQPDLSTS